MKRGRKLIPTVLKTLHGNPGKRALPKGEPEPSGLADVRPPAHLSREAKREWRRLAPQLIGLGLLTVADLPTFAAYCSAWGDFVEADRTLRRDGTVISGKEGQPARSPWFLVKARAVEQIVKIGDRFGFSPSSRIALASDGGAPVSDLDRLPRSGSLAEYLAQNPDRLPPQ